MRGVGRRGVAPSAVSRASPAMVAALALWSIPFAATAGEAGPTISLAPKEILLGRVYRATKRPSRNTFPDSAVSVASRARSSAAAVCPASTRIAASASLARARRSSERPRLKRDLQQLKEVGGNLSQLHPCGFPYTGEVCPSVLDEEGGRFHPGCFC